MSPAAAVSGTVSVRCPTCDRAHEVALVQSLNARREPELVQRLLAGDLNVLACGCGKRTQLAAKLLYHDPDRDYFCQVCPGGEAAMAEGRAAFAVISTGTRRLVPSQNALVEKVKLLHAGLRDTVVEVLKVLLLAARGDDINGVLLFVGADRDASVLQWHLLAGTTEVVLSSPLGAYEKLAMTLQANDDELQIDRAWAVEAARAMVSNAN